MSDIRFKQIVVLVLLMLTCLYTQVFYEPVRRFFDSGEFKQKITNFPRQIGDWQNESDIVMGEKSYQALNPRALIFREYTNSKGDSVILTIVYHENQRWGAHDVEVCYTSQGWSVVKKNGLSTQKINLKTPQIAVNKMEVEKPRDRRTVIFWWFSQGKQQMTDRIEQMVRNIRSSILYGYNASGLVRISAKGGDASLDALTNFAQQLDFMLDPYLP